MEEEMINKQKALDNAKKEIDLIKEQIENSMKFLDFGKKEYDLKCKNHLIALEHYYILKPTWAFEENPEYLTNLKELSLIGFERFKMDSESKIKHQEGVMETLYDQLEGQSSYVEKLENEVKEMGEKKDE